MKLLFTGGGTGGHFYPVIAVVQAINKIVNEERLLRPQIFFMADKPFDPEMLYENGIEFIQIPAGKMHRYFSLKYIPSVFKTFFGILKAIFKVYKIYPDVIFSKGGYSSFPVVVASRIFRIPLIIHESDSAPGKVNKWSGKFARKIAISFAETSEYFPKEKVALTGVPLRKEMMFLQSSGAREFLKLEPKTPVILIVGGSQGAKIINESILEILPELLEKYQVIHQVGDKNLKEIEKLVPVILENNKNKDRYKLFGYLNSLAQKMATGVSSLVISRAGSSIFEFANWGLPSILIPISRSNGDHQRKNAFNYARAGACLVIEEKNLSSSVLRGELDKIMENEVGRKKMAENAKKFSLPDASEKIGREILRIAIEHEN